MPLQFLFLLSFLIKILLILYLFVLVITILERHSTVCNDLLLYLQDMQDMRDCYDSLLSAAAATANSAYGTISIDLSNTTDLKKKMIMASGC